MVSLLQRLFSGSAEFCVLPFIFASVMVLQAISESLKIAHLLQYTNETSMFYPGYLISQ
jgi:hypothetical protein